MMIATVALTNVFYPDNGLCELTVSYDKAYYLSNKICVRTGQSMCSPSQVNLCAHLFLVGFREHPNVTVRCILFLFFYFCRLFFD